LGGWGPEGPHRQLESKLQRFSAPVDQNVFFEVAAGAATSIIASMKNGVLNRWAMRFIEPPSSGIASASVATAWLFVRKELKCESYVRLRVARLFERTRSSPKTDDLNVPRSFIRSGTKCGASAPIELVVLLSLDKDNSAIYVNEKQVGLCTE